MSVPLSSQRRLLAKGFSLVEDAVYLGLGLLLATSAVTLLVLTAVTFLPSLFTGEATRHIVPLLDQILLTLLVVELLYTVQVSFREHAVTPEPFLLIGLIAAIRRVLLLTAEFGHPGGPSDPKALVTELAVLSALIVAIAISLFVLRRKDTTDKIAKP